MGEKTEYEADKSMSCARMGVVELVRRTEIRASRNGPALVTDLAPQAANREASMVNS